MNKVKYKPIKNVLSDVTCDLFTSWIKKINPAGDDQIPQSNSIHSKQDHFLRAIHHFVKERIEYETCLELKPTYAYTRIYYFGSDLVRHLDRPACEISCTITLNYSYTDPNYEWPIFMGDTPFVIPKNDGVIYKGMEVEHWRPVLTQPHPSWHHQMFLHYVDANGHFTDEGEDKEGILSNVNN